MSDLTLIQERLAKSETLLPDDYPVYGGYLYVADGKVIESNWHDVDVAFLKRRLNASEIRRCDIAGHSALTHTKGKDNAD